MAKLVVISDILDEIRDHWKFSGLKYAIQYISDARDGGSQRVNFEHIRFTETIFLHYLLDIKRIPLVADVSST